MLADLLSWREGQDLQPLVARSVALCGVHIVTTLSRDPAEARNELLDIVAKLLD